MTVMRKAVVNPPITPPTALVIWLTPPTSLSTRFSKLAALKPMPWDSSHSSRRIACASIPEADMVKVMQAADMNSDGTLDWEEFLTATLSATRLEREERLRNAFAHFDADGDGFISQDEMRKARRIACMLL